MKETMKEALKIAREMRIEEEEEWAETLNYDDMEDQDMDGVYQTYDGCDVEPDGVCPHGYRSPLLILEWK